MYYFREPITVVYDKIEFFMDEIYEILDEYVKLRDEKSQMTLEIVHALGI